MESSGHFLYNAWDLSLIWQVIFIGVLLFIGGCSIVGEIVVPSLLVTVVLILFVHTVGIIDLIAVVVHNPWYVVGGVFVYGLIGAFWSVFRYKIFIRAEAKDILEARKWRKADNPITKEDFVKELERYSPSNKVESMVVWLLWWPPDLFVELVKNGWRIAYAAGEFVVMRLFGGWFKKLWQREVDCFFPGN